MLFGIPQPSRKSGLRWHCIHLQAAQLSKREHERMAMLFNGVFMAAGRPCGAALWMTAADNEDGASIYLSPRSIPLLEQLIRQYGANASAPPPESAVLIAGSDKRARQGEPRSVGPRTTSSKRSFLPARYTYRSVRALTSQHADMPALPATLMAPFVRHFVQAWPQDFIELGARKQHSGRLDGDLTP